MISYGTKNETIESLRHKMIDNHILMETLINNAIKNYFCDTEKNSLEFLFLIMQKENSFGRKIGLLRDLKLYENKYLTCSKKEYEKGIKCIEWVNERRNNMIHNFVFTEDSTKKTIMNVVKKGKVNRFEIDEKFIKELNNNIKE